VKKKKKTPTKSKTRKALEANYASSWHLIPDECICPKCGVSGRKESMERHHIAGRSKSGFLFTVMIHSSCHRWVHDNPAEALEVGLLWKERNTQTLTIEIAQSLIDLTGKNLKYPIQILKEHESR